jgi:hypothetical protein
MYPPDECPVTKTSLRLPAGRLEGTTRRSTSSKKGKSRLARVHDFVVPDLAADAPFVVSHLVRRVQEENGKALGQRHFGKAHLGSDRRDVGDTEIGVRAAASVHHHQRTTAPDGRGLPEHKALQPGSRHYFARPARTLTLQLLNGGFSGGDLRGGRGRTAATRARAQSQPDKKPKQGRQPRIDSFIASSLLL